MELLKQYWHRWAFMIIMLVLIYQGNMIALVLLLAYLCLRAEVGSIFDKGFMSLGMVDEEPQS